MIGKIIPKLVMWWAHRNFDPDPGPPIDVGSLYRMFDTENVWISDLVYNTAYRKDIEKFLTLNIFKFREYVPEKYDCDNYSFSLMGLFTNLMSGYAIGIVWAQTPSGLHALNFFIDENKEMWYIEPQNNKVFQDSEYQPFLIVM